MKYTTEIVVDVPREEFIKKMDDPQNMRHWQRGLVNYEQGENCAGMTNVT